MWTHLHLARFYCTSWETDVYLWPKFDYFQLFSLSKTQVKSTKIKANDRSSIKYVKTQEYYNILLSILKKQVTNNFAAVKAPICDCPWLFMTIPSLVKPVADTRHY